MVHTNKSAKKAARTLKERYGEDYFSKLGKEGRKKSNVKPGFQGNPEAARKAAKKRWGTLIVVAACLIPSVALADYSYPLCKDDPNVTCYNPPQDAGTYTPSYPSGQYPEGWTAQHYASKGQDEYGHPLPTKTPHVVRYSYATPEATPPPNPPPETKLPKPPAQNFLYQLLYAKDW